MKALKTVLVAILTASIIGCAADQDLAALMTSAKQYIEKREFAGAVIQLKNVLQQTPDNAEARYLLGLALIELDDPAGAQIELGKALALGAGSEAVELALARTMLATEGPDKVLERFAFRSLARPQAQAELTALVGLAHLARKQPKDAEAAFSRALTLDPANVSANLGAARLAAAAQDFAAAIAAAERALAAAPASSEALMLKADLLSAQGRYAAAEEVYGTAVQVAPHRIAPRLSLINHLLRQRALDKASAEVAALERIAPRSPQAAYATALLRLEQENFAAAGEAIQHVLKVAPKHVPSLTLAGMAALRAGALVEAESHLRKAVFEAPQATGAKRLLVATHLRMGKTALALSEVSELLKLTMDPAVLALAGEAHLANGDLAAAARYYEQARSLAPSDTGVQTRLALIHLAAGEEERGVAELESASAANAAAYQADLALITNHLRRRQADKALAAISTLERKQPNNPMAHNLKGLALVLKRQSAAARVSFERALELQPSYIPALRNLAQLDVRERRPQDARERYEAILQADPNNVPALTRLAVLLRMTGADPQDIEKLFRQSVAANPASRASRLALIDFFVRSRDFKAALVAAQQAHAALPDEPAIVQALGRVQVAAGEARQAIATLIRLVGMRPTSAEARLLLARAHMAAKQPDEAIEALRAALAIQPNLLSAQRDIAAVYVASNRHDDALREAKAMQAKRPADAFGYALEGEIYMAQKKLDLAERAYRVALGKFDLPALAVRTHAILEAAGKRSESEALAEDWIRRHPKDTTLLAYLGERDIVAKRYASAAARYEAALAREPENPMLLNNLAWVANELKRPDALAYAERAHELAPDGPEIMDTLGAILTAQGQHERGLALLGHAAELAPEAHQIRLNFAKALIRADRKRAAKKELESLAALDSRLPVQQEATRLLGGL